MLVGEENKPPFIRVWKPSSSIRVLKPRGEARKGKPKEDNICQRWIWVVTNGIRVRHQTMCQPSLCSPKGVDTRRCASKDAGPSKGVDLVAVLHRSKEGVPAMTLGPEGGWIVMSHIG